MKYSKLFGKTLKDTPRDATLASHKLLYQAGFIRESTAGRYYFLPLGMRVHDKIKAIIKEEMDNSGAQEIITPLLHPKYLWEETNRTKSVGFELMSIKDRNEFEFVLGGTAEEMLVDLVRKFQISYKDLPFNLYQFSTKFRDEIRARGGLLRLREFVMKDAYSFHATEEDFKKEYKNMRDAYTKIIKRVGLESIVVEADNGYIGGDYCHEFIVESSAGENKFFTTEDGSYAAHEEIAKFQHEEFINDEEEKPLQEVEGKGIIGVSELAKYLKIPVENTTKTILFEDENGNVIAAAVQGEYEINETKLMHIAKVHRLQLASAETVKRVTGAEIGYAGLLNLPKDVRIFIDESIRSRKNFEMGANRTNYHSINVNFGRDLPLPEKFYDFKLAKAGYNAPNGKKLIEKRGIEVGNIFQLGFHYSSKMKDALFTDENGKKQPYYMGCYGFGLARTLTTIVEKHYDDKGIIWPKSVAPFQVHLISIRENEKTNDVYIKLQEAGVEVLYDEREDVSAGQKFADADLIGIPVRLVVSTKTEDKIEYKERGKIETKLLTLHEVIEQIR
ncbi:MAG TPA: proline--tRNA ligase [Candidatus Sulfotelmatobacter sp.]|jgi:prolyl-tRNA synthetase|nr:proline--tRNA ligase [Candidatus Sulfotelmatobacter sp.]